MYCSAAACLVSGGRFLVAHVGDTRVYLARGAQLRRLTTDHTLVLPGREGGAQGAPVLTRALGIPSQQRLADVYEVEAIPGDHVVLATRGLHRRCSEDEILRATLAQPGDPGAIVARILGAAERGPHAADVRDVLRRDATCVVGVAHEIPDKPARSHTAAGELPPRPSR
jgi:protein phosphatase